MQKLFDEECNKKIEKIEIECDKKIEEIESVLMKNSYHKVYDKLEKKYYPDYGVKSREERLGIQDEIY
jgi:hypothetical protein